LNEKEKDPKLSRVDIANTVESKIKAEAEHERVSWGHVFYLL